MVKFSFLFKSTLVSALIMSLFSCEKNEDDLGEVKKTDKYIVAFQAYKVGEDEEVDYLLDYSDLSSLTSGTISAENQGIAQTNGWSFFYNVDNTIFSVGYEENKANSYSLNAEGELYEKSAFTYSTTLNAFSDLDGETLLATELNYSGYDDKGFYSVSAETGFVTGVAYDGIDTQVGDGTEDNPGATPWVTGMILRDGKLFVSYHKWDGLGYYITPDVERAYVAVYSYPEFKLEKIIDNSKTSPIGTNGHSSGLVKTEDDDIYSYSSSSLSSGFTAATKPSGVLKIASGSTDFDEDYFFDVENATNGGKIFWMDYVGNGKALARIILDDQTGSWGTYFALEGVKLVVLDLENKTVTDVSGIENHYSRYTSHLYVEDGLAYLGAETGSGDDVETAIYVVDAETATATKGAVVEGKSIKGIYKVSNY